MKAAKKLGFLLAGAAGFVLGSRSGRKPYESLEEKTRQLAGRPKVQAAKDAVGDKIGATVGAATERVRDVRDAAGEKLGTALDAATDKANAVKDVVDEKLRATEAGDPGAH